MLYWLVLSLSSFSTSFTPSHNHRTYTTRTHLNGKRGKRGGDGSDRQPPPSKYLDLETIDWFDKSTNLNDIKNSMNDYARDYYSSGGAFSQNGGGEKGLTYGANSGSKGRSPANSNKSRMGNNNTPPPTPEVSLNDFDYGMVKKTVARSDAKLPKNSGSKSSLGLGYDDDYDVEDDKSSNADADFFEGFSADDLLSSELGIPPPEDGTEEGVDGEANGEDLPFLSLEEDEEDPPPPPATLYSDKLNALELSPQKLQYLKDTPPRTLEGFTQTFVSAVEAPALGNLKGVFTNFGVEFIANFDDFHHATPNDQKLSIEDAASFEAREVFRVTNKPTIASRTSFEVDEFVPPSDPFEDEAVGAMSRAEAQKLHAISVAPPRVTSAYWFNDIGDHVEALVEGLLPHSHPERICRFKTCVCYYDGEMEVFDYGTVELAMKFVTCDKAFISVSHAITSMGKTLKDSFDWEYQGWMNKKKKKLKSKNSIGSSNLRERVLRDGRVLPNNIVDVSKFMDSMIDVNLMDECAAELAERFLDLKPTKVLTVATTGLVAAIPISKYLQVPCVYARKQRTVVMSNCYHAGYSSKTVGQNRELLVSKDHVDAEDRILIVDDFLSSGSSQEALLRIISDAGATAVGVSVLIEKKYDKGRKSLSGYNVRVESLVAIDDVNEKTITIAENE